MQLPIYLVIDASADTIIVHPTPEIELVRVEVWTYLRTSGFVDISKTAGNILEVKEKSRWIHPKPGDIVISSGEINKLWYINKYLRGDYNSEIKAIMDRYSITDYRLPKDYYIP